MEGLQPHQVRVVDEQQELQTKINALEASVEKYKHDDVFLVPQLSAMKTYNDLLLARIATFK